MSHYIHSCSLNINFQGMCYTFWTSKLTILFFHIQGILLWFGLACLHTWGRFVDFDKMLFVILFLTISFFKKKSFKRFFSCMDAKIEA
jgi:hypothetical protein